MERPNRLGDYYRISVFPRARGDAFDVEFVPLSTGSQLTTSPTSKPNAPPPNFKAWLTKRKGDYDVMWYPPFPSARLHGSLEDFKEAAKQAVRDYLSRKNP
jgi:hypothetical protein